MAIAFVDVEYARPRPGAAATAACVVAERWTDAAPVETHAVAIATVREYEPGRFFERELPCLLAVLPRVVTPLHVVVVDGYVVLDEDGTPGLGAHLHDALGGGVAVVGVAKTAYRGGGFAVPVLRGGSRQPLYVTARGIAPREAADHVASMHGPHRVPTLLGWVDRLAAGDPPPYPISGR
jgi:deoxyribonuclease V